MKTLKQMKQMQTFWLFLNVVTALKDTDKCPIKNLSQRESGCCIIPVVSAINATLVKQEGH